MFAVWESRLKLAEAVYLHKAYDCPHDTKTLRWRAVVGQLKSNNSNLFALMQGPELFSYVGVHAFWELMYADWKARDDLGSKMSGAYEDHDEFHVQMENIRKARVDGEGQKGNKRSRNSYGIGGSREEALAKVNQVLAGSVRGQAATAEDSSRRQIEHGEVDDNGVFNPVTAPGKPPPADRQTDGKGRTSSLHQSASVFSEAAGKRAQVDRERIELDREALQGRGAQASSDLRQLSQDIPRGYALREQHELLARFRQVSAVIGAGPARPGNKYSKFDDDNFRFAITMDRLNPHFS